MQRARPTKVAHGQRSGRHEPGMVVGFACAGTENTWCARRTLPHAQFILLIFQALSSAPRLDAQALAEPPPYTLCGCEIRVQKAATPGNTAPPAVGCAVRTKEKILRRRTFPRCSRTTRRCSPAWRCRPTSAGPSLSIRPRPWRSSRTRRKPTCQTSTTNGCSLPWPGAADRPSRSRPRRHSRFQTVIATANPPRVTAAPLDNRGKNSNHSRGTHPALYAPSCPFHSHLQW